MDLAEIITQLNAKHDILQYLVVRKEYLNLIGEVNGVVFDVYDASQLFLAQFLEKLQELEHRRNTDNESESIEEQVRYAAYFHIAQRNKEGGGNLRFVGNYCLVMLYQYWEDNIRPRIAEVFGVETRKIAHPLFGDIRNLRNAIIHNRGIATSDVEENELLRWYKRGDAINLDKQRYVEISQAILNAMLDHEIIPDEDGDLANALRQLPI